MIEELVPVRRRWEETHAAFVECVRDFPPEHFQWRPAPGATTAAAIVTHTCRAEVHYAFRIHDRLVAPASLPVSGDPREAARREVPGEATDVASGLDYLARASRYAADVVGSLTTSDLQVVVAESWHPLGPRVEGPLTALWFIEQMNRHKAYHLGQLWYLRMLLE